MDSLSTGDHKILVPSRVRALLGFLLIAIGIVTPKRRPDTRDGAVWFVVSNPVAHGARLCASVSSALKRFPLQILADHSVKDPTVESQDHFPGLGLRSIAGASSISGIWRSIVVRRALGSMPPGDGNRFWAEYLFFAQTLRYMAAREAMLVPAKVKLVIVDFDRAGYGRPIVYWAKRAGIPIVTLVHGSPVATTYMPILADSVLVWGECQRNWLKRLAPEVPVHEIGRSDVEFEDRWSGRVDRLVICHSGEALTGLEEQRLNALIERGLERGWVIRLRVHPSWGVKAMGPGWAGVQNASSSASPLGLSLKEDLTDRDVVVVVSSSAAVDAIFLGVPVFVIADEDRALACDVEEIRRASEPLAEELIAGGQMEVLFGRLRKLKILRSTIVTYTGQDAKARLADAISALMDRRGAHIG
ncbi:hypothetical protein [Arthrobacter subterraneus]|nr:hypothetical protein [Arthrobacter subterraneus]